MTKEENIILAKALMVFKHAADLIEVLAKSARSEKISPRAVKWAEHFLSCLYGNPNTEICEAAREIVRLSRAGRKVDHRPEKRE